MSHLECTTQKEVVFVPQQVISGNLGLETFYEEVLSYSKVPLSEIKERLAKR